MPVTLKRTLHMTKTPWDTLMQVRKLEEEYKETAKRVAYLQTVKQNTVDEKTMQRTLDLQEKYHTRMRTIRDTIASLIHSIGGIKT